MLMADAASLEATDERTFKLALKEPFPLMLEVLGKPTRRCGDDAGAHRRHAADQRIPEPIGSGHSASSRTSGGRQRHGAGAQPRLRAAQRAADFLAGGKRVSIDQLTLRVMPTSRPAPTR